MLSLPQTEYLHFLYKQQQHMEVEVFQRYCESGLSDFHWLLQVFQSTSSWWPILKFLALFSFFKKSHLPQKERMDKEKHPFHILDWQVYMGRGLKLSSCCVWMCRYKILLIALPSSVWICGESTTDQASWAAHQQLNWLTKSHKVKES